MPEIHIPGDAVPPIKQVLIDAAIIGGAGLIVADEVPADWDVAASPTLLTVADDGGPTLWPVWTNSLIRVTVYANGKQRAKVVRAIAWGLLLARVPPGMNFRKDGIGYTDARDPDTGADMASFTVPATVRTQQITVE